MSKSQPSNFECPACGARYRLVRVKKPPEVQDRPVVCISCKKPLSSREGDDFFAPHPTSTRKPLPQYLYCIHRFGYVRSIRIDLIILVAEERVRRRLVIYAGAVACDHGTTQQHVSSAERSDTLRMPLTLTLSIDNLSDPVPFDSLAMLTAIRRASGGDRMIASISVRARAVGQCDGAVRAQFI